MVEPIVHDESNTVYGVG